MLNYTLYIVGRKEEAGTSKLMRDQVQTTDRSNMAWWPVAEWDELKRKREPCLKREFNTRLKLFVWVSRAGGGSLTGRLQLNLTEVTGLNDWNVRLDSGDHYSLRQSPSAIRRDSPGVESELQSRKDTDIIWYIMDYTSIHKEHENGNPAWENASKQTPRQHTGTGCQ